jgi:hypothetical protein
MAAQNPNHNEVMSLDPVDGRDIRVRGRSRDISNPRNFGPQNQNLPGYPNQQQFPSALGSNFNNFHQMINP